MWIFTYGLGEETGWRGFALPRLQKHYDARKSFLILGLLWAAWHIPVFFYGYDTSFLGVLFFLIGIVSGAGFLTWMFNGTGGSVLAAILWHGTYNAVTASGDPVVSALATIFVVVVVIIVAKKYGPGIFSSKPKQISK